MQYKKGHWEEANFVGYTENKGKQLFLVVYTVCIRVKPDETIYILKLWSAMIIS